MGVFMGLYRSPMITAAIKNTMVTNKIVQKTSITFCGVLLSFFQAGCDMKEMKLDTAHNASRRCACHLLVALVFKVVIPLLELSKG